MASKRIFMTGANGYVGSTITEFAVPQGYEVHGLSRSEKGDAVIKKLGGVPVRGDLTTIDVIRSESSKADIVMHLADAFGGSGWTMPYDEVIKIDVAAVNAMVEGLKASGKESKVLIGTSGSLMAKPNADGTETDETAEEVIIPGLERIKLEKHLLEKADEGIKVSVVRLAPFVYGRGGSGVSLFTAKAAEMGEAVYVGDGNIHTTTVHVDDAARLYLLLAEKPGDREVFNATFETHVTMKEMAEAIAAALGVEAKSLTKEDATAKLGPFFARFLSAENRASGAKAMRLLGWQPKEPGVLEDIKSGSYQQMAKQLRKN